MASVNRSLDLNQDLDVNLNLSEFCKNIMKDVAQRTDNKSMQEVENIYEQRCLKILKNIDKTNIHNLPEPQKCQYLQTIAQFVLELTYIDECKLVEEEFPPEDPTTFSRVMFIIDTLSRVDNLAQLLLPNKSILESLGPDILECLHWRKGALFYMYCHTLNAKQEPSGFPDHYQKCLENGVEHLKSLLCTRNKPQWLRMVDGQVCDREYEEDDHTFLLTEGLYSDIHLLALMYCGELCYWLIQHSIRPEHSPVTEVVSSDTSSFPTSQGKPELNVDSRTINWDVYRQTGQACLKVYIKSATGPLSPGGWSTNRAEEIINYLNCH
ncbi:RAB7A-interacting MON1-CCZ1 complex subunit 1-like isoform X1 [Biomphalaria glabrata]|uniref:RAB7A-interacting MON1-CCZ1 complex subunit 1-like isoform X1 n=1 Tax=Biomphalaria glabrata TaxID=6526 RepID=A0A9U8EBH6_BIOGL|nr:RAB7A-interacting MON1-CCZ1 complex subunit 1-like isoform X1 [Biomphalaria glabrata]